MVHHRIVELGGYRESMTQLKTAMNNRLCHPFQELHRLLMVAVTVVNTATGYDEVVEMRKGNKMGRSSSSAKELGFGLSCPYEFEPARKTPGMFDIHQGMVGTRHLKNSNTNTEQPNYSHSQKMSRRKVVLAYSRTSVSAMRHFPDLG